ncbi:Thermophilic metalloprotease (M29) [Halobacillus dabanensis]|uniref:Thermophilic metalloprotease (M29) n=1 Tax=Halobacillus dabanensis TaxID=240302 RepID=A0A1I4AK30_HALDA|nr:Thermophilic metalloprotease (M29) [Halobacillus dabanensis]
MMNKLQKQLEKYADLALNKGVNLQRGQGLIINAPIEAAELVRAISAKAYGKGAKNVHLEWNDEHSQLYENEKCTTGSAGKFPEMESGRS